MLQSCTNLLFKSQNKTKIWFEHALNYVMTSHSRKREDNKLLGWFRSLTTKWTILCWSLIPDSWFLILDLRPCWENLPDILCHSLHNVGFCVKVIWKECRLSIYVTISSPKDKARPHPGSTVHTILTVWKSFQSWFTIIQSSCIL